MYGHGRWFSMYIVLTIPFGYHPGDGVTDRVGGVHGDQYIIMITMHTGGHTEVTTQYVIATEFCMRIKYTDHVDLHP